MYVCMHQLMPDPFGLVIVEAMINGVPVIASDTGAPVEIIENEMNGYIVSPIRPLLLADKIKELLINAKLREESGRRSRMDVRKNYNIGGYAHSVERVFNDVLGVTS